MNGRRTPPWRACCAASARTPSEVVARYTGAEWWETGGEHWLRTPDGRLWDPIDEARRCYGGDGSLRLLCREATGDRARR